MNQTEKKKVHAGEIQELMGPYALEYMNEETYALALKLLAKLVRKRTLDITKGKREGWAAAIIHVIARANFMFDKTQDYWMTADEIASFFGVSKSGSGQKATLIEKACKIGMFDSEFITNRLANTMPNYVQLSSGFIVQAESIEIGDYAATSAEELEAKKLFDEAAAQGFLKEPRSVSYKAEQEAKAEAKKLKQEKLREERERLAAEQVQRDRDEFDRFNPSLF